MIINLNSDYNWLCPVESSDLVRVGRNNDGGYIIPQSMLNLADGVLSLGLGDDWSFDTQWRQMRPDVPIHLYDKDPDGKWNDELRVKYHNFWQLIIDSSQWNGSGQNVHFLENIYAISDPNLRFVDLATAISRLGGLDKRLFLKFDIENGEWIILDHILRNYRSFIGITCELHDCNTNRTRFRAAVEKFKEDYNLVHIHANNITPMGHDGLTNCMELTFVRKDILTKNKLRTQVYLDGLDYSNDPDKTNAEDPQYVFTSRIQNDIISIDTQSGKIF